MAEQYAPAMPFEQSHLRQTITAGAFYASRHRARRLVIFIHGFRGSATGTWGKFLGDHSADPWWSEADLLFVGYDSMRESIIGVADRLRSMLDDFYPLPSVDTLTVGGVSAREDVGSPYSELVILAHSLGGVIARRALLDALVEWKDNLIGDPAALKPAILHAQLRLFSPASAGFRPAGALGALSAVGSLWGAISVYLRSSSAYSDLQQGSTILQETRRRTEALATQPDGAVLRARILWANPEDVVVPERYDTDFVGATADGRTHRSVCKPDDRYRTPLLFGATGRPR